MSSTDTNTNKELSIPELISSIDKRMLGRLNLILIMMVVQFISDWAKLIIRWAP